MTNEKSLTTEERLALVRKAQAERAAQQPDTKPAPAEAKSADKKRQKVLSRAALARQEQEKLEASKTKVEKIAESIATRNKVVAKHGSVQRNLDSIKDRKPKAPKLKLKPVPKIKEQEPVKADTEYEAFVARNEERERQHHILLKQADGIKRRMANITRRDLVKLAEALRDCYGIYEDVESGKEPWMFYDMLRAYLKVRLVRLQSNTPDEGVIIRYVFEDNKNDKQVSEYGTVLRYALDKKISKNDFVNWYLKTTQTKILALARGSNTASTRDKLMRARQLLLRYFDIREEWPLGVMEYPERLAARQVHLPNDLIFVICRGVRRFDRGAVVNQDDSSRTQLSQAEVRALHFIPPVIDVADDLINRLARYIVPRLEDFENEVDEKAERVWANDLTSYLTENELGTAYKSADKWADRMQAAIAEDQVAFAAQRKKIQKLRKKSRE